MAPNAREAELYQKWVLTVHPKSPSPVGFVLKKHDLSKTPPIHENSKKQLPPYLNLIK
jgi:hypothetical protein